MNDTKTETETGSIRVERTINAPAERIYNAFLDRHAQAKFSPPHGWVAHYDKMEPKVGGQFHGTFRSLDGTMEHSFGGTYLELEEFTKIRLSDQFDTEAEEMDSVMETTITLEEVEGGTKTVVEQTGIPAPIPPEDAEAGWGQSLELLALLVEFDAGAGAAADGQESD